MTKKRTSQADLVNVRKRVKQKRSDYISYDFSPKKNDILKTFFDLAQEFDSLPDFYRVCVTIPLESFEVDSKLYLLDESQEGLMLFCDSEKGVYPKPRKPAEYVFLSESSYEVNQSYLVPIFSRPLHADEIPESVDALGVIGMFEVFPLSKLTKSDKFFFTKYTNRIGYNLRKRMLSQQNIKHLRFINKLVSDIEHNVIIPNMYYRHLFNQLRKKLNDLNRLSLLINQYKDEEIDEKNMCETVVAEIDSIRKGFEISIEEINKHHLNQSLFLESLFRRDHFQEGRLVLRQKVCKIAEDIIEPQLEHYQNRLLKRGITIQKPDDMQEEEIELNVDLGLISQVYANLFSNAVKYSQTVTTEDNQPWKAVAYGRNILYNYFGPGRAGIKLNVFTTGHNLSGYEKDSIFEDGFIGENSSDDTSTGHGLAFVKYVVELHGGVVGYEPTFGGNNFYFILPLISKK